MKTILAIICLTYSSILTGQKIKYPPRPFTMRNARIAAGIGLDFAYTGNANSLWLKYQGATQQNKLGTIPQDSIPLVNLNLALDLYAPNSLLSFYSEIRYSVFNFTVEKSNQFEVFRSQNLDIPLYLKFRFGSIEKRWHVLWMLGGGYTIPLSVQRNTLINPTGNFQEKELDNNKDQFLKSTYVGSILGVELVLGKKSSEDYTWDKVKLMIFAKYNYRMSNMINNNYANFTKNSFQFNYDTYDFRESHFTIGMSVFLRLNQAKDVASRILEGIQKQ